MSQRPAEGRDRIRYLERQVEEKREASRRADTLLAQLSAANAQQARTIRALEVPSYAPPEPRESPESPGTSDERSPTRDVEGSQAATKTQQRKPSRRVLSMTQNVLRDWSGTWRARRPWWRRLFGS